MGFSLTTITSPQVMGILNVTPDSFSDGGVNLTYDNAVESALRMIEQGAHIIDIGGESTRPGAQAVSESEELDRVIPVIEAIRARSDVPISLDTSKTQVMREGLVAGASMINDVNALRADGAIAVVAEYQVPVCLMHMQGQPRTMQQNPTYVDVVADVKAFLQERLQACVNGGINSAEVALDPGFGFGKSVAHNYTLLNATPELLALGQPVLIGISRKSMLGAVTDKPVEQRLASSVAAATIAANFGAHLIRVHDVDETVDALKVVAATKNYQ
ncbi:dihydropteroate synthase [Alteromonas sp. ASW11-36]|uniref:Dihydropteroate synthase n=1 Tax=Alteromonas arenosi TaxID=3055817 RepID=A0ABT7SYM4_9ALTE|nr:dihydropteroate synthase [Alteromonas sp. ASW11-36]MDM7860642.1 dihydropteroate synthase [Alteromonas sp. ASW11-36]